MNPKHPYLGKLRILAARFRFRTQEDDSLATSELSLVQAAQRAGLSYQMTLNAILRGELRGRQDERRHWFVDSKDLERFQEDRKARITAKK